MDERAVVERLVGLIVWDGGWFFGWRALEFGAPVLQTGPRGPLLGESRHVGLFRIHIACESVLRFGAAVDVVPGLTAMEPTTHPDEWMMYRSLLAERGAVDGNPLRCTGVEVRPDGLSLSIGDDGSLDLFYPDDDEDEQWRLMDTLGDRHYVLYVRKGGRRLIEIE